MRPLLALLVSAAVLLASAPALMAGYERLEGIRCGRFVAGQIYCETVGVFRDSPVWWVHRGAFEDDPIDRRFGHWIRIDIDERWAQIRMRSGQRDTCIAARWSRRGPEWARSGCAVPAVGPED